MILFYFDYFFFSNKNIGLIMPRYTWKWYGGLKGGEEEEEQENRMWMMMKFFVRFPFKRIITEFF